MNRQNMVTLRGAAVRAAMFPDHTGRSVSRAVDMAETEYSAAVRGRRAVTLELAAKIAQHLGVTVDAIAS